jgi:hypothetical protein
MQRCYVIEIACGLYRSSSLSRATRGRCHNIKLSARRARQLWGDRWRPRQLREGMTPSSLGPFASGPCTDVKCYVGGRGEVGGVVPRL